MFPHERSLVNQLADKPFAIVGVNGDPELEQIRAIVKEKDINWRSFWNGEGGAVGPITTQWNITGWPTIYVLDHKGVIRYKNPSGPALDEAITTLLGEMGHQVDIDK